LVVTVPTSSHQLTLDWEKPMADRKASSPSGRLFIFGWDGADWEVIKAGWAQGRLPVLRSLAERGEVGTLLSTIPPITSVAWTSFITGREPGDHGIFGFRSIDPETYRFLPIPGGARRVPTLMQELDRDGIRTCTVTVPWTYPADQLEVGVVVPGWDAPDETLDDCHPPEIAEALAQVVPRVPRRGPSSSDHGTHLKQQAENIELRERISRFLIRETQPDVFMVVFSEPDHATHHLWEGPKVPQTMIESYQQVDDAMGRLIREFVSSDDTILVVSDHGSQPMHTFVHIAYLLSQGGWLKTGKAQAHGQRAARSFKRQLWYRIPPRARNGIIRHLPRKLRRSTSKFVRSTRIDWGRTMAFPVGSDAPGIGICINVNPPFREGCVGPNDYDQVRERLRKYLASVTNPSNGETIFEQVLLREEAYSGPELERAPHLLLIPTKGYAIRTGFDFAAPFSTAARGEHRREGIYLTSRPMGLQSIEHIHDILPKVLGAQGLSRVSRPGREGTDTDVGTVNGRTWSDGYTGDEAKEIEDRLRSLGYIE
jgi:predicted AlkP superfamily phosphohydrolase/phosphomutase